MAPTTRIVKQFFGNQCLRQAASFFAVPSVAGSTDSRHVMLSSQSLQNRRRSAFMLNILGNRQHVIQ
jgi:hypothetical protein